MKKGLAVFFALMGSSSVFAAEPMDSPVATIGAAIGAESYPLGLSPAIYEEYVTPTAMAAFRVWSNALLSEVSNPLYVEGLFGKALSPDGSGYAFGAQLRWDLRLNSHWIPFAKVGVGGSTFTPTSLSSSTGIGLTGGVGVFYRPFDAPVDLRLDIATLGSGIGISFEL